MFTLGKVLISTRGLAPGNYHFYMNAKPSVAMVQGEMCQCPLGLIPHFYQYLPLFRISQAVSVSMPSRAYTSFLQICKVVNYWVATRVNALSGLYLISTIGWENEERHNLMCQCPLGLIPHFYGPPSKT